jgi:SNF2 family DNA or RNA helicase
MTIIKAYLHKVEKTGNLHVRVYQDRPLDGGANDAFVADMHKAGSPANWYSARSEWDYPLTAACVLALQKISDKYRLNLEWSPDLIQFAQEQKRTDDYEQSIRLSIENLIKNKNLPIPAYMTNTIGGTMPPMRHQQISFQWGLRFSGLLLAHDPGLGKTRSAIDLSRGWYDYNIIRPMQQVWDGKVWGVRGGILVITKAGMVRTWRDEFAQWQSMTALEISGERKSKMYKGGMPAHAHVINYESLSSITHNSYDALILDEIHSCANASGFTENSLRLAQSTRRRLGLTGTPIANNLESAFYQMLIIDGGKALGSAKTKFLEEYFRSERQGPGGEKNIAKQGALEAVSERMARCTYFLKKDEVLTDLPLKTHTPVYLEMTPDQERYYNQVRDDYLVYIQDTQVTIAQAAGRLMKLRQVCQGFIQDDNNQPRDFTASKVDALIDMLKGKLGGRKVVVWAVFTHEINMLCHRLVQEGIGYVRMDGTVTSKKQRDIGLQMWNSNSAVTVFIGQIQLGVGITLHAKECMVPCFDCVYLGIDYSFINWTQSQDRIHRIGQKYPCSYTYLLTKDGIDRNIYRSLQAKANTSQAVYKAGKEFYSSLVTGNEPNLAAMEAA